MPLNRTGTARLRHFRVAWPESFGLLSCYRASLGPRNWELIQPFKRSPSTWTQSPSRFVTWNRVPLRAAPTTVPLADGVDLMFTPGRCKKTISALSHGGTVWRAAVLGAAAAIWGAASKITEGGRSGQATALGSARDGSGIRGAA